MSKKRKSSRRWSKSNRWRKRKATARKFSGGSMMREKKTKQQHTLLFLFFAVLLSWPAAAAAQFHPQDTEWPSYAADTAGTRYRPLDQINASNFSDLEIAWRIKTDNFGDRPEYKLEGTPLMVNGALYATAGSRRAVIALDPATGELLWIHGEHEGKRGGAAPRQLSGRGLAYWSDGKEERILYVTPGFRLICLDAKTGVRIPSFGNAGEVDLKLNDDQDIFPDLITGEIGIQSAPVVAKDTVIIGAAFREGMTSKSMRNNKGYVRGFDVRTGKRLWIFHTIPKKGEFGYDTWEKSSAEYTGNTGVWTQITVDGKPVKAVAQPSKQGFLYVFDRATGKPIWPIPERPVEVGNVPGEWYSPTQPIPSKPAAYSRNGVSIDDLIDFTPALREQATEIASKFHLGPVYTPPTMSKLEGPLGTLTMGTASGGTNWPGGSYDPETHNVYVYACNSCIEPIGLVPAPREVSDLNYIAGTAGKEVEILHGPGENAGADSPKPPQKRSSRGYVPMNIDGLPLVKPPYGTITAINLDRGEFVWQIAHGETPDVVRNYEALKDLNIPRTGQETYNIGTLVTKTLVIAGEGHVTTTADHPRGAMLRAYDKATGKEVGAVYMPAPQTGSPMTYMLNGKQYIVVAVSGGPYSGEYIAYTLPSTGE